MIAAKYFTVLLFYFPIFLAFAINFRVLLTLPEASFESRQFWNSSMISIFRTFTMLTDPDPGKPILFCFKLILGDIFPEFLDISSFSIRTYGFLIYMTFYFFISVVFINLLNAYAVANVTKIEGSLLLRAIIYHFLQQRRKTGSVFQKSKRFFSSSAALKRF